MLTDYILPGTRIELKLSGDSWMYQEEEKKIHISEVYDVVSEDRIDVMMPLEHGKLVLLPINSEYNIAFYSPKGLFQCEAQVADRYKSNNMYVLSMNLTSSLQKLQRREYYRFSCAIEAEIRVLSEYETMATRSNPHFEIIQNEAMQKAVIVDISGGGMRFVSEARYEEGAGVFCKYTLFQNDVQKSYQVTAKILRVKELENRPDLMEYRIKYTNISRADREDIIHYIFEEERRIRRK